MLRPYRGLQTIRGGGGPTRVGYRGFVRKQAGCCVTCCCALGMCCVMVMQECISYLLVVEIEVKNSLEGRTGLGFLGIS